MQKYSSVCHSVAERHHPFGISFFQDQDQGQGKCVYETISYFAEVYVIFALSATLRPPFKIKVSVSVCVRGSAHLCDKKSLRQRRKAKL